MKPEIILDPRFSVDPFKSLSFYSLIGSTKNQETNYHEYNYWSLGTCIRVYSEMPFFQGDSLYIESVTEYGIKVYPSPVSNAVAYLHLAGSPIPLSSGTNYSFTLNGTGALLSVFRIENGGLSNYVLATIIYPSASVIEITGCTADGTRIRFSIDCEDILSPKAQVPPPVRLIYEDLHRS